MEAFSMVLLVILGTIMYLIPTFIAAGRKHSNSTAIFIVNLFFGWTFIGWIIALIWASTDNTLKSN